MFQRYGLSFWPCSSCAEGLTCGQGPQCYLFRKWNIFDARSLYKSSQVMKCGRVLWTPSRFFQERLVSKGNGFIEVLEISLCSHTSLSIRLVLTVGPPLRRAYRRRSKWQIGKTLRRFCYSIVRISYMSRVLTNFRPTASVEKAEHVASGIYMSDPPHSYIRPAYSYWFSAGNLSIRCTLSGECAQGESHGNGLWLYVILPLLIMLSNSFHSCIFYADTRPWYTVSFTCSATVYLMDSIAK